MHTSISQSNDQNIGKKTHWTVQIHLLGLGFNSIDSCSSLANLTLPTRSLRSTLLLAARIVPPRTSHLFTPPLIRRLRRRRNPLHHLLLIRATAQDRLKRYTSAYLAIVAELPNRERRGVDLEVTDVLSAPSHYSKSRCVERGDSLDNNSEPDRNPAKNTRHTLALLQIRLKHEECNGAPEENLQTANNNIRLIAMPSFALLHVFYCQHVREEDERFGALAVSA